MIRAEIPIIGPMPVQQFYKDFMLPKKKAIPSDDAFRTHAAILRDAGRSSSHFVDRMKTTGLCKDLKFVDTSAQCTLSTKAAQVSVYSARACEDIPSHCDWNMQSFVIKLMPFHFDPFCAQADPSRPLEDQQFIRFKQDFVRDRLIAHIIAIQQCQYRTHCFALVLLGKHHARFLRWDRGGLLVTDRFDFRVAAHSHYLPKFLWLYDNLTEIQRGHDPTVSSPSDDEKQNAWAALHSRYPNIPVSVTESFRLLEVHAHDGKRLYVVGDPYRSQRTPCGRDTEWFIAYGVTEGRLVYLKDSWCIDECGFMREGETYRRLHAHDVPFIPTLVCYGDVPGQNTMTHNYMDQEWCFGERDLLRYQHIRLVVNEISADIRSLGKGMKGIVMVIHDVLQAQGKALDAEILHGNISDTSITVDENGKGLLVDWDLARYHPKSKVTTT